MSKLQLIYNLSPSEAVELLQRFGSISKVLSHFNIKNDPRCRAVLSAKITESTGNTAHSDRHKPAPDITKDQLVEVVKVSTSVTQVIKNLGLQPISNNFVRIKNLLLRYEIEFAPGPRPSWTDEAVYCKSSSFSRNGLSNRVKRDAWLPYICVCGNDGAWQGKPLRLHLDHIDGDSSNHEKTNLRWLCPNCHTQTDTYAGRNNRKSALPTEL